MGAGYEVLAIIYDRGTDGSECEWASVIAYEPPDRVIFSWSVSPYWQVETDPGKRSEVEVRFIAEGSERQRRRRRHQEPRTRGALALRRRETC